MTWSERLASLFGAMGKQPRCRADILEVLFNWYGRSVYRAAFLILRDKALAEDVTQETFLAAYTKLDSLQNPDKAEAWLVKVAMNRAYDLAKNSHRLVLIPEPGLPEEPDRDPILDFMLDQETAEEIRALILKLPAPYQEILYFKYYREMTSKQIAGALGIPEGTVKSRLSKAKLLISRKLARTRGRDAEHADR
jgi:RNA polymerase sigma-70 factor (ECF subfamily)